MPSITRSNNNRNQKNTHNSIPFVNATADKNTVANENERRQHPSPGANEYEREANWDQPHKVEAAELRNKNPSTNPRLTQTDQPAISNRNFENQRINNQQFDPQPYVAFFVTIGVPIFLSHQLKDSRTFQQRFKEDNYWDFYLKRSLVNLRENDGVEPLLTKKEDLAKEMCKQFNFKDECAKHFIKYYELYMLEYYRDYVEKNGNDLSQITTDLRTGKARVRSLMEQQREKEVQDARTRQTQQETSYSDEGDVVTGGLLSEQRRSGNHPSDVDVGRSVKRGDQL